VITHDEVASAPFRQMSKPKSVTPFMIQYRTISSTSIGDLTFLFLMVSMTSPGKKPAASARPPGCVAKINAPFVPASKENAVATAVSIGRRTASSARDT
jgi:hypothetical protein